MTIHCWIVSLSLRNATPTCIKGSVARWTASRAGPGNARTVLFKHLQSDVLPCRGSGGLGGAAGQSRSGQAVRTTAAACILVLSGRGACILEQFDHENGRAKVILPDIDGGETWLDLETLKEHYLNFAFLIEPESTKLRLQSIGF